ncbi:MAG: HEAT repeat domain-containing protein [Pirellulaceae bacterium]
MTGRSHPLRRIRILRPCLAALVLVGATSCNTPTCNPEDISKFVSACSENVIGDLRTGDEHVRKNIVDSLIWTKVPALVSLVKERLDDPSEVVRIVAASNDSVPVNDKVRKILKRGIVYGKTEDFNTFLIRYRSAVRLANEGDSEAITFLINATKNRDLNSRFALAEEIAETSEKRLLPCAAALLNDESCAALGAAEAAAKMGETEGLTRLRSIVNMPNPTLAGLAAESLGRLGDREAVPQIRKLLQSNDALTRIHAARALVSLGDPGGLAALREVVRALRTDDERIFACSVLGDVGDYDDISMIEGIIRKTADTRVHRSACIAAVEIWYRTRPPE